MNESSDQPYFSIMVGSDIFIKAMEFSIECHKTQKRKGTGDPYIMHPIRVMCTIMSLKDGSVNKYTLATAALLHDVVEDCGITLGTISQMFGYSVAALVKELTSPKSDYETMGKANYLAQQMCSMSSYALTLKLCDRLDNVEDMKHSTKQFQQTYVAQTNYILDELTSTRQTITRTQKLLISKIRRELAKYNFADKTAL